MTTPPDNSIYTFLDKCVICERNQRKTLVVRMDDLDNGSEKLIGIEVTAKVLKTRTTLEHEWVDLDEFHVELKNVNEIYVGSQPIDLIHVIDSESPFYELGKKDLEDPELQFELLFRLTGSIESTGAPYQVYKSYNPRSIKWGYQFEQFLEREEDGFYVNGDKIDKIKKVEISPESQEAKDLEKFLDERHEFEIKSLIK